MEAQRPAGQFRSSSSSLVQDEMNVYLKIVKTVHIKVKGTDTIGALKANINQKEGISEINHKLFFNGKLLSNAQTMADSGIQNHATLHLFANDDTAMKIFIKIPSDSATIALEAKSNETVQNIKLMIQEGEGLRPNSFTLVYNGNLLEDEMILSSVGIRNNSTVILAFSKKEVFTIFVKPRGMDPVKLSVKSMFTVGDVKAIVMAMIGESSCNNLGLYRADDYETMAFYDVTEGSGLDLFSNEEMKIFVKTDWRTLTLIVRELDTVDETLEKAKKKLQNRIPNNANIILVYAGKLLKGHIDLASYGVRRNCTLHMVLLGLCS